MKALLIIDLQNDFLPGGPLAVQRGDEVIPVINCLTTLPFDKIIATKDWHPPNHGSFAAVHGKNPGEQVLLDGCKQILWPTHCVQGTRGAEFPEKLNREHIDEVFFKGKEPLIDSYSAFCDNQHKKETGLESYLKKFKISELYVAGLATDYCVKFSVLDALERGFQVYVIADACRAVNVLAGDGEEALHAMEKSGAKIIDSQYVANSLKN